MYKLLFIRLCKSFYVKRPKSQTKQLLEYITVGKCFSNSVCLSKALNYFLLILKHLWHVISVNVYLNSFYIVTKCCLFIIVTQTKWFSIAGDIVSTRSLRQLFHWQNLAHAGNPRQMFLYHYNVVFQVIAIYTRFLY